MNEAGIILHQAIIFLIIMFVGYIAFSRKILTQDALPVISSLFINITLPALIFVSITAGATREDILGAWYILPVGFLCYALLSCLAFLMSRLLHLRGEAAGLYRMCSIFGNMGFIGIPLATAVYGSRAMVFISVYTIVDQMLTWTYGVSLIGGKKHTSRSCLKDMGRKMLNAPFISTVAAIALVFLRIPLPGVLRDAFTSISQAGSALSFLYIGGMIALYPMKSVLKCRSVFVIILTKMICFPLLFCRLLSPFIPDTEALGVIMIAAGLPSISMAPILARRYGAEEVFPTSAVIITTVCSVITYPVIFCFKNLIC